MFHQSQISEQTCTTDDLFPLFEFDILHQVQTSSRTNILPIDIGQAVLSFKPDVHFEVVSTIAVERPSDCCNSEFASSIYTTVYDMAPLGCHEPESLYQSLTLFDVFANSAMMLFLSHLTTYPR